MKVLYRRSRRIHAYIKFTIYNRIIEIAADLCGPRHINTIDRYPLFLDHIEPYITRIDISKGEINVIEIEENYQNLKKISGMFRGG